MTQPVDQTPEERARAVGKQILEQSDSCKGVLDCLYLMEALIAAALADERRAVWEEAYEYVKQYHFNVSTSKHATKACVTFEDHFRAKAQEVG